MPPKRGPLWDNDGSCAPLRPERKDRDWAYNLVLDRTSDLPVYVGDWSI